MSGLPERKKGIQIHRSVVYGTWARPLTDAEKETAPPGHTHKWIVFFRSATSPPPQKAGQKRKRVDGGDADSTPRMQHGGKTVQGIPKLSDDPSVKIEIEENATASSTPQVGPNAEAGSAQSASSGLNDKPGAENAEEGQAGGDGDDDGPFAEDPEFITGGADDLSWLIKRVQFKLHETYQPPMRNIDKPPYQVEETGWGEFSISIKVFFHNETGERHVTFTHQLRLHHWGPEAQVAVHTTPVAAETPVALADSTPAADSQSIDDASNRSTSVARALTRPTQPEGSSSRAPSATPAPSQPSTPAMDTAMASKQNETGSANPASNPDGVGQTEAAATPNDGATAASDGTGTVARKDVIPLSNQPKSRQADATEEEDADGEIDEEDAEGEVDLDATPAGSVIGAADSTSLVGPDTVQVDPLAINSLPVHSWQYDEIVFHEPTQHFFDMLIAHPQSPLPPYSKRKTIPEGKGAIPGIDRGNAGVPLEFTLALEKGESDRLDEIRRQVIEEMDHHRQRLIELEREQMQLKDALAA